MDEELEEARENGGLVRSFCIADNHFECHHNSINTCAFSNDERRVASCSTDGQIRLWDLKSGRLVKTMLGHTESVMTVAFSDEGQVRLAKTLPGAMRPTHHALSPPLPCNHHLRQRLISAGLENNILVWNISSGEPLRRFYGHDDAIYRVAFINNASGIISCSMDKTVKTW